MIEIIDEVITIPNWDKHQTLDAYEKKKERDRRLQAERRARQKALIQESSDNRLISGDCSSDVAVSEEEEEKDKEKEFHSFIHLREEEEYIDKKIADEGLEGNAKYKEQLKSNLKGRYIEGSLGKGVVFMSNEQFEDLCDKLSIDEMDKYFGIVAEKELMGHHYKKKTHYQAILEMACKDRKVRT
jgi:hypothetical protein